MTAGTDMVEAPEAEILHVPVEGGELTVGRWGTGERVVVAVHGITANHTSFGSIAAELGEGFTIYAVDLRGRGGSAELPGPYGMRAHARDCLAVLDHVGVERAVFAGHSMGGFVVGAAALEAPERVEVAVMVDGGIPLVVPEGVTTEQLVAAVIGPARARLEMTFASVEEYLDFWRAHPSFQGDDWTPLAERYFRYDIHEVDGSWRSKVRLAAIEADAADTPADRSPEELFASIDVPIVFAHSPRGLMNGDPLYAREVVESYAQRMDNLQVVWLEDVNHYSLAMHPAGAAQVAEVIRSAAERHR